MFELLGIPPQALFGQLLLGQMLAKVVLSVVMVPPLIYLFVALGRRLDTR